MDTVSMYAELHPALLHRVTIELIGAVVRLHFGLLGSKLRGKASTNLGATQKTETAAWDLRSMERCTTASRSLEFSASSCTIRLVRDEPPKRLTGSNPIS